MSILNTSKPENRLSVLAPRILTRLHPTKNDTLNPLSLTKGMKSLLWWQCENGHEWQDTTNHMYTNDRRRGVTATGCYECAQQRKRKYPIEIEAAKLRRVGHDLRNTTAIGDATELYVKELLEQHNAIESVERCGEFGGSCDLIVRYKDGMAMQLQVKTLIQLIKNGRIFYKIHTDEGSYSDKMLIGMVDKERTKFALEYSGNLPASSINFNWDLLSGKKSKNDHLMYTDESKFTNAIVEKCRSSEPFTNIETTLSRDGLKEYNMSQRIKSACLERDLEFKRNSTNGNTVDGAISTIPIQMKYTSDSRNPDDTGYFINLSKVGGVMRLPTGKNRSIPVAYDENDPFEYVVVEIGTPEGESRFPGEFLFIPKIELIKQGKVKSKDSEGRLGIIVYTKDYPKEHWTKQYWNRWDLLTGIART